MPPDCEDNALTQTAAPAPERTPAYHSGFGPNTGRLSHLIRFSQKATKNHTGEVKAFSTALVGLRGPGREQAEKIKEILKEIADHLTGGVLMIHEMMPVLFVTVVEAYLKDVLIYAAEIDTSIMDRTKERITYQDALNAKSIEELKLKFRPKWARRFVDNGGPTNWIESLKAMGATGYRPETVGHMETLWGVRHLIVHSACIVDVDFVRRHPELKAQVGKRLIVNTAQLRQWSAAMYDFVEITDQYFVRRCQKSQNQSPNADALKAPETQGESLHAP